MDIRQAVLKNLEGSTKEEIRGYIQDTVDTREEQALPGMGILLEAAWKKADDKDKDIIMDMIMKGIRS